MCVCKSIRKLIADNACAFVRRCLSGGALASDDGRQSGAGCYTCLLEHEQHGAHQGSARDKQVVASAQAKSARRGCRGRAGPWDRRGIAGHRARCGGGRGCHLRRGWHLCRWGRRKGGGGKLKACDHTHRQGDSHKVRIGDKQEVWSPSCTSRRCVFSHPYKILLGRDCTCICLCHSHQ